MSFRIRTAFVGTIFIALVSGCATSKPDAPYEHSANPKQHKEEIRQITFRYFGCVAQQARDLDDGEVAVNVLSDTAVGNCEYQFNSMQRSLYSLNLNGAYVEGMSGSVHRSAHNLAVTTILRNRKAQEANAK